MSDRTIDGEGSSLGSNGYVDDGDATRETAEAPEKRRTRRTLLSVIAGTFTVGMSGCLTNPWGPESDGQSGEDGRTASDGATDGPISTPNSSETDTENETTESEAELTPPLEREPSQVVEVAPDGFRFDPESFEIDAGETVRWIWMDSGHNLRVRAKPDGSDWEGTPGTASDTYDEGYEHAHTFDTPGEYRYFCAPHQTLGLEGSFIVR